MPSIITWIIQRCRYCQESNLYSCSQNTISVNFLKPTLHSVPLTDGSVSIVPIFDVKAFLIACLNDPLRMCQENFASNYDIFTRKAKLPTSTLDEIHTGSLWEMHFP